MDGHIDQTDETGIDTVDLRAGDAPTALDLALRKDGFVQLVGHGLPDIVANDLWASMDRFFALPVDVKRQYVVAEAATNRGYRMRGSEALSYSLGVDSPPDLFESFNCGHDERARGNPLITTTPWPGEVPDFASAAKGYLAEMASLSRRLDEMIGALLGIEDLAGRSLQGPDTMACIRYERHADEERPVAGQKRMGAHSDYTSFTLLRADPVPGLEILGGNGWKSIVPEPGALLMNVGDLLAIWTDDAWPSTLHRVPLRGDDPTLRRSVAYFHYPDLDTVVAPLPNMRGAVARYGSVTVGEHLAAQLVGPKQLAPSTGTTTLGERRI